jgi:hypothetical protein
MRATRGIGDVDSDRDGEGPSGGDDDPTASIPLGVPKQNIRHHSVAQEDQDRRAQEFRDQWTHVGSRYPPIITTPRHD